jgi:hypothetical protein
LSGIGEATGILGALKTVYDLVHDLRKSNDVNMLKAGIEELSDRLLASKANEFKMSEEYKAALERAETAEEKLKTLLDFEVDEEKYILRRLYPGAFVYREKQVREGEQNPPNYCANCFGRKQISILQPIEGFGGPLITHVCPMCKIEITFRPDR